MKSVNNIISKLPDAIAFVLYYAYQSILASLLVASTSSITLYFVHDILSLPLIVAITSLSFCSALLALYFNHRNIMNTPDSEE